MLDPGDRPKLAEDELGRLIDHVFLPRKLPNQEAESLIEDEANILSLFTSVIIGSQYRDIIPIATRNLFKTWCSVQASCPPTSENVSKALGKLSKGNMFGYYVRAQNAGILIYADSDQEATLCTFPASLRSDVIMSNCLSKVIGAYPEQTIKIPKSELLSSEALARQIVTLTNQEMLGELSPTNEVEPAGIRDVADTLYVSEWLTSLLSDATSRTRTDTEFPKICKNIRDQIVWKNSLIPFRRSGMWMTAKVILQLSLYKSATSQTQGKFLYKLIMAELMREMCQMANDISLDADIGMFMIKKLARRVKKLQTLEDKTNASEINKILTGTSATCEGFKNEMLEWWKQQIRQVILPKLKIDPNDTIHDKLPIIPSLKGLSTLTSSGSNAPTCAQRVQHSVRQIPNVKYLAGVNPSAEKLGNLLFETESWILQHLDSYVDERSSVIPIRTLAKEYIELAASHYEGNPIRTSRMVLTFLKVVHVLDQIAVKYYPMLKDHRIGVNPIIIQQLLLPLRTELELAHTLELYCENRDRDAKFPALTEEDYITVDSFSVKYAKQDKEMYELREKILLDSEHKILGKRGQLKHARKVCEELRVKIRSASCACSIGVTCGYHTLQEVLVSQRVKVYERPLRSEPDNQFAVVFELLIPPEIACIRDVVRLLLSNVCRANEKSHKIEGRIWTSYKKLRKYSKGKDIQAYFQLGSTTRLSVDICRESHPDNQDSVFIVNNGYNCTFAGNYEKSWKVKKWSTLKVEPESPYTNLQWTLETTNHFQNQVLAAQVNCHEKLRLSEYKDFGSLRAGHRLQLRNIYRALVEKSLSLKEESVFALICQGVWEAGPPGKTWCHRESHEDLANVNFAEEWIKELTNQLEVYQKNWTEAYTLLLIIVLVCRALEFGQVNPLAIQLLLKCRKTAYKWIGSIEDMITKSFDSPAEHVQKLRMKLLDACICVCWTYAVGPQYIDLALSSERDFFYWIHALARIYNITCSSITTLSDTRKILVSQIQNTSLNIETKLAQFLQSGLDIFVIENWNEGTGGMLNSWESYPSPAAHVFQTTFQRNDNLGNVHLQIDVLRGAFLVNGLPVGYLPENITKHPTFTRIFKNIVFEVYPAFEEKTFVTLHRYNNADYRFSFLEGDSTLIIRERTSTNEEFQLIPDKSLQDIIPPLLIQDHSHWLNVKENWIDFRPVQFDHFEKSKPKYRLHLLSKELTELSTGKLMFSVASPTHRAAAQYLARLEDPKYIHTILQKDQTVVVHLPRMRLTFQVNPKTSHLENSEYAMAVCPDQSYGTLIGLCNGLLLENEYGDRKLLIPHGSATVVAKTSKEHHQVKINLKDLNKPSVFIFDLNDRLKQLRAGKSTSGWLYLAYLHAITSSALADPFTGLTGTEEAFRILQSGHCWSCKPYEDQESLNILKEIKRLAPSRKSHNKIVEIVSWPNGIPSSAAQDGFRFIVDKLLADSNRLDELFKNKITISDDQKRSDANVLALSTRAYIRYEPLCSKEGKISEDFLQLLPENQETSIGVNYRSWTTPANKVTSARTISESGHSWHYKPPTAVSLSNFLVTRTALQGLTDPESLTKMSIVELLGLDFRKSWMNLYELARTVKKQNLKSEWTTILSILAFGGVDLNQLLLLQGVAVHPLFFQAQHPPNYELFLEPNSFFNELKLQQIFSQAVTEWPILVDLVTVLWPIETLNLSHFGDLRSVYSEYYLIGAIEKVNAELKRWTQNTELRNFVLKVEQTIPRLPNLSARQLVTIAPISADASFKCFRERPKFRFYFDGMVKQLNTKTIAEIEMFKTGFLSCSPRKTESELQGEELLKYFETQKEFYHRKSFSIFEMIKTSLVHTQTEGLFHSDLFRVTPTALMTRLLEPTNKEINNQNLKSLIGAMGVLWTLEQRAIRCIRYYKMGAAGIVHLMRERENRGHLNWSPYERPEWLLFEIESNLMIRPVQIDVANQMMNPPEEKHSVMQLNMGEGKTAVIVPLLALALANGEQICRVTVLKSLFKTNRACLVFCLGGILGRRLYTFPCQRDLAITGTTAENMLEIYEECRAKRGVVLTLPEHRLSFQLKGYEKSRANDTATAVPLMKVQNWLASNVRDILDESDEILHVKYQLIYTLGSQLPVDGGALRWSVAQSLLKLIPPRIAELQAMFGEASVDFNVSDLNGRPEIFHHTRLLKKECYSQLIKWLAEDILDRKSPGIKVPELLPEKRALIMDLLTDTEISEDRHREALALLVSTQETAILILMGYLKYEILYLVLTKRYRVNYGVDPEGDRKMAVPFRAKDIPSKRTEFGHPDVAIVLTQLSYYYSGLSKQELDECFTRLDLLPNKESEYASWIRAIPTDLVDASIKSYSGINLADLKQKDETLFPVLKYNMVVIDFWLAQVVFPKESRVFEKKLVCTPWDLCSEDFVRPITGFSGTNDSTVLLPAPMSQQDLPQLQSTNDEMREIILLDENNELDVMPRGTTSKEILMKLIEENTQVLLDAGALMLELDNDGVARKWLELLQGNEKTSEVEAAVYYDDDELRVKHRDYLDESVAFHSSSYVDKLDKCVIYLDDVHTRGTDLRIPPPSRACVTLCAGITRDKMIQACMRMRLLGKGHTVHFFANDEAGNGISQILEIPEEQPIGSPGSRHIMEWVCRNSREFEKDGLVYWAASGLNYAHKRLVESVFRQSRKSPQDYVTLGEICCDQEFQSLQVMYGEHRHELRYLDVLESQIQRKKSDLTNKLRSFNTSFPDQPQLLEEIRLSIVERCEEYIADKTVVSYLLDEEQEKENEEEKEEERQIIRPPARDPAKHNLYAGVVHFVKTGQVGPGVTSAEIVRLHEGLKQTSMWSILSEEWCREEVYLTKDFVTVIVSNNTQDKLNEFLRSPNWIATFWNNASSTTILMLSPFEANELIPVMKSSGNSTSASLRMFAPRLIPKQPILTNSAKLAISFTSHTHAEAPIPRNLLPPLFVLSGTMFFVDIQEQSDYCHFTGIIPNNDRTITEEQAFIAGQTDRGFLLPNFRAEISQNIQQRCAFTEHPERLIREIIETRHGFLPQTSHVSKLVLDCRKVDNFDN